MERSTKRYDKQWEIVLQQYLMLLPGIFHFILAWLYRGMGRLSIVADSRRNTWDWFWQTAPMDLLIERPFETIWNFHAQPPFFNVLGAILGQLFYPHHLEVLYTLNIFLGTFIVISLTYIIFWETDNKVYSFLFGCFLAFYPAIFVYEAYILYTIHIVFLITLCIFWMALFKKTKKDNFLYLAFATLVILVLYRSFFHPVILLPTIPVILFYAKHRLKSLGILSIILLPLIIILMKNYLLFGFVGTSSWSGINLYKIISAGYSREELNQMVDNKLLDAMVVDVSLFSPPNEYLPYGFDEKSSIPILSRDDHNNINYPKISDLYFDNAIRLLKHDPIRYVSTIVDGYISIYVQPSSRFKHTIINARRMSWHERLYNVFLDFDIHIGRFHTPLMAILIPIPIIIYILFWFLQCKWKLSNYLEQIRCSPLELTLFAFIVYGVLVGNMLEYGENDRFKFLTELHIIALSAILLWQVGKYLHYRHKATSIVPN